MNEAKLQKLNDMLADVFEVEKGSVTAESRFVEDLDASSMKRAIISAEIEDMAGISISSAKIKFMQTVGELYDALADWLK